MALSRRVSATFKDLPGGQLLGPTYDYTQRLLDFGLLATGAAAEADASAPSPGPVAVPAPPEAAPRVIDLLNHEGLVEDQAVPEGDPEPFDLTRQPLRFPADRSARSTRLMAMALRSLWPNARP